MSRLIPSAERLQRAHALIEKARQLPPPPGLGRLDFSYIAEVKSLLQEARDLVKFIPKTPSATPEMKAEVTQIFEETKQVDHDLLRIHLSTHDDQV